VRRLGQKKPMADLATELRKVDRHDLAMELRFSYRSGGVTYLGTGRTRNLGGDAVCFEADQEISGRGELELHITWPFRLQSICPLELVVRGALVRKDASVAVLRMQSYEFQTRGERSFNSFDSCGAICDVAAGMFLADAATLSRGPAFYRFRSRLLFYHIDLARA
jgi:hypothetical protein